MTFGKDTAVKELGQGSGTAFQVFKEINATLPFLYNSKIAFTRTAKNKASSFMQTSSITCPFFKVLIFHLMNSGCFIVRMVHCKNNYSILSKKREPIIAYNQSKNLLEME